MNKLVNIQEIVNGCLRSDRKQQKALVEHFSGLLYVICNRYLGNAHDAQDATQESLALIFRNIKSYDKAKGEFKPWATTITIRHCLNKLTKRKSKNLNLVPIGRAHVVSDFEEEMLSAFSQAQLLDLVLHLPEGYRIVFNMAAIDGHTHKEISTLLKITENNSRIILNRARKILQSKIIKINRSESWVNTK